MEQFFIIIMQIRTIELKEQYIIEFIYRI